MKQTPFVHGFLIASLVTPLLVSGCKKDDAPSQGAAAPTGSAGPTKAPSTATGSGSAAAPAAAAGAQPAAAAGAPAAGAPAAGAPAGPASLTAKRDGNDEGTFNKALYFHRESAYKVAVASNCDTFNCAHIDARGYTDDEILQKDCPNAKVLTLDLNLEGDPKPGDVETGGSVNSFTSGGSLTSDWVAGGKITEVSATEIKGSVDFKDGTSEAKGTFTATICK